METAQRAQSRRKAGDSRPVAAGKPSQTGIQVLPKSDDIRVAGQAMPERQGGFA